MDRLEVRSLLGIFLTGVLDLDAVIARKRNELARAEDQITKLQQKIFNSTRLLLTEEALRDEIHKLLTK